jgi:hypothetical protein
LLAALLATVALVLSMTVALATPADARTYEPWGKTSASNQVLKRGCHYYYYSYKIHAPTPYWAAEIFLKKPNHRPIASDSLDANSDPSSGRRHWSTQFCNPATVKVRPGRFKISMKVTYCQTPSCTSETPRAGFVKPSYFRFLHR